jgi:predicted dinucleotide-binding enzyme
LATTSSTLFGRSGFSTLTFALTTFSLLLCSRHGGAVCAPAGEAQAAERLIADVGLRPVCVGDLAQASLVDSIGALWGALVFGQGRSRRLAFKVLAAG